MTDIAWYPDPELAENANATAFMRYLGVNDFSEMVRCADTDPERFYSAFFDYTGFRFYQPYERLLDESEGIENPKWCIGGTTNVVLNGIDRWRDTPTYDKPALIWEGEDGARRTLSYRELDREICRLAGALRSLGLSRGDTVALYMPNVPEAVIAMNAVAKIGAIMMPLFSGFGAEAIATRLQAGGARAIIATDSSTRRGKLVNTKSTVDAAVAIAPVEHVVVLRQGGVDVEWHEGRDHWWHELCDGQPDTAPTEEMEADAPYLLVYTSGTTGKPKGVVHTHVGFPAKMLIDLWLVLECKPEDRVLWMSDMGWIIGSVLVYGVSAIGATLVLVDGAPNYPDPDRMWRVMEECEVTYLGIAPTTIRTFMVQGSTPAQSYDLSAVRIIISSGEAWSSDAWWWLFRDVFQERLPILNFSGGTEMVGMIGSNVLAPLKPCSCNCAVPGTGADVVDENGVSTAPGVVGELVQRRTSIGLTRGLWRDQQRYIESYWSTWPGIWHHGDSASRDEDGQWYVHGRSDDTMNIAGKRTGPSEVESLLLGTGLLSAAAAIGVPDPVKGSAIAVFCCLRDGVMESGAVRETLSQAVVRGLGTPFRPQEVIFVSDLPKTRSMKVMRRVIRAVYCGDSPGDLSSVVNPECIDELRGRVGSTSSAR